MYDDRLKSSQGYIAGYSIGTIPSLKLAPSGLLARQWQTAFDVGKATAPWLAFIGGAAFSYLATEGAHSWALFGCRNAAGFPI